MGASCSVGWHLCEHCSLFGINVGKTASVCFAVESKAVILSQGKGEMEEGIFVFWNRRAIRHLRAQQGSAASAPPRLQLPILLSCLAGTAGLEKSQGNYIPQCPRSWGALVWHIQAVLGLLSVFVQEASENPGSGH